MKNTIALVVIAVIWSGTIMAAQSYLPKSNSFRATVFGTVLVDDARQNIRQIKLIDDAENVIELVGLDTKIISELMNMVGKKIQIVGILFFENNKIILYPEEKPRLIQENKKNNQENKDSLVVSGDVRVYKENNVLVPYITTDTGAVKVANRSEAGVSRYVGTHIKAYAILKVENNEFVLLVNKVKIEN